MNKNRLGNGVRVVTERLEGSRSVSFGIWVHTGSRYEKPETSGISHLMEHMLFKGTTKHSASDIADLFDSIGGNVNAFTTKEYTCYYAKVLDTHLPIAVDALSDMFFHSAFDSRELDKEKNVIFEEIAMYEDTPDDYVHDLIAEAAYGDHPLAWSILGDPGVLSDMTSDDLRKFARHHYTVDHTVIAAAGNVDERTLELIDSHFGRFDARGANHDTRPPAYEGGLRFHAKTTEQNHLCLALPGMSFRDDRLQAMIVLNNIIGGGMSSRLFQDIREKRGLAYSIYSYHSAHEDSGLFTIYTGTHPKHTELVIERIHQTLSDIADRGVTDAELHRTKEQLKGSLILSLESSSSRMNRIGKNELMLGKHEPIDDLIAKIDQVTRDDIARVAKHVFSSPFAAAMVGSNDNALQTLRRDPLVVSD